MIFRFGLLWADVLNVSTSFGSVSECTLKSAVTVASGLARVSRPVTPDPSGIFSRLVSNTHRTLQLRVDSSYAASHSF